MPQGSIAKMFVKIVVLLFFIAGMICAEVHNLNAGSRAADDTRSCIGSTAKDEFSLIQVSTTVHSHSHRAVHENGAHARAPTDTAPGLSHVAPTSNRSDNAVGNRARHRMASTTTRTGHSNGTSLAVARTAHGIDHNNGTTTRTVHGKHQGDGTSPEVSPGPLSVMKNMEPLGIDGEWSMLPIALATTGAVRDEGHNRTSPKPPLALLSAKRTRQPLGMEPVAIGGVDFEVEVVIGGGVLIVLLVLFICCCGETYFRMCCPWQYLRYMTCMHRMKELFHL